MVLSKRLERMLEEISCSTLADVGSDHGILPVSALLEGRCKKAIATDISPSSKEKVMQLASAMGVCGSIEFRLGDGLAPIHPGEAQVTVVSGMGGLLIESMLRKSMAAALASKLILSPQRDQPHLRRSLHALGFVIKREFLVFERNKPYNIFVCEKGQEEEYTELECMFGRRLLEEKSPELSSLFKASLEKDKRILHRLKTHGEASQAKAKALEVERSVAMEEEALRWLSKLNG
jgi:tRNA (adenine22-N1)-methyltransferase